MSIATTDQPMTELDDLRRRLLAVVESYGSCVVAYSGGVDSAVVAKAARLALGDAALAVTGVSPSLAEGELAQAEETARLIGIRHLALSTSEMDRAGYVRNAADRCFYCKSELYALLESNLDQWGVACIVNGANADDLGDHRPGMKAAGEFRVRSPLAECGLTKANVRELARSWGLPIWDKPAAPCLASRIAYGEEVTPARLAMIDKAEQFLRAHGFTEVRVRYHKGDLARLEAPLASLAALCGDPLRQSLIAELRRLGFKFVTVDLEGFRSGSLNSLIPPESLFFGNENRAAGQPSAR